jgi:hypothetical protein
MLIEHERLRDVFEKAFADVDAQLYHEIKAYPSQRESLLAQMDVLILIKERLDARIDRKNPFTDD